MRLTDEQLAAGWLHQRRAVRNVVAKYFNDALPSDPDVTRHAIQAVDAFGWKDVLVWPHQFCSLPLMEEASFEWVCHQVQEGEWLLEPLARTGKRFAPELLDILNREASRFGEGGPDDWIIGMAIILAGHLRLEAAVPLLWKYWECDWDWYSEELLAAYTRIGTPSVVQWAQEHYPGAEDHVRCFAYGLFERVRCPEAVPAIEVVLEAEHDDHLRGQLGIAAAYQFDERLVPLALRVLNEDPDDPELGSLREALVAFSYLSGYELPERDAWEREIDADEDRLLLARENNFPKLNHLFAADSPMDRHDNQLEIEETLGGIMERARIASLQREGHVGRNEPCPCGSDKKYKKCFLPASGA